MDASGTSGLVIDNLYVAQLLPAALTQSFDGLSFEIMDLPRNEQSRDLNARTSVSKILRFLGFILALLLSAFGQLSIFAQARRISSQPTSSPTPVSESPQTVNSHNDDPYKVVFPVTPDLESTPTLENFVKQLNKAGEQKYRLISVVYRWQKSVATKRLYFVPVAILKLDEVVYEYTWFETTSSSVVTIDGFGQRFADAAKQGFRLADHFQIDSSCDSEDALGMVFGGACDIKDVFLLQRRMGVDKPENFILARSPVRAGFKVRNEADLSAEITENLAAGFYPTEVLSKWEILLTHNDEIEKLSADKPDVRVVMSLGTKTVREKVNELGKQGYRLLRMNKGTAVMYRYGETGKPFTYYWLKAGDKKFDEQLAKLQADGAIYRMSYPEPPNIKNRLVFEQGPENDGKRREYKLLRIELQVVEEVNIKGPGGEVHIDLADSSREISGLLKTLASEGFIVRDLFTSDFVANKISVLLERSQ